MKHTPRILLGALLVLSAAACTEARSQPAAVDVDALIEAAPDIDPAGLTDGLDMDPQLKAHVDASLAELHAAMLQLHERHEELANLDGAARTEELGALKAHAQSIHERHQELWNSIPEDQRQALVERMHGQLRAHHERLGESHDDAQEMHEKAKEHLHRMQSQQH